MYNQQKKLGEEYELIIGLGLLNWITPSNQRVRRHILVAQASLSFDAARGIISVQPAADGVKLSLESDMLEPSERPAVEQQLSVENALVAASETPWHIDNIPQEMVRNALETYLPPQETIDREVLLRKAAHHLGFSKVGRKIRKRLNRAIGAEMRAGRLQTDSDWKNVWRPQLK